jgi:hypothetical protein
MSPANGHTNDSANIPTTAVQQFAPPASDINVPTGLTLTATKVKELIANLEVPFHPSVVEWRVTNTSKGGSATRDLWPRAAIGETLLRRRWLCRRLRNSHLPCRHASRH